MNFFYLNNQNKISSFLNDLIYFIFLICSYAIGYFAVIILIFYLSVFFIHILFNFIMPNPFNFLSSNFINKVLFIILLSIFFLFFFFILNLIEKEKFKKYITVLGSLIAIFIYLFYYLANFLNLNLNLNFFVFDNLKLINFLESLISFSFLVLLFFIFFIFLGVFIFELIFFLYDLFKKNKKIDLTVLKKIFFHFLICLSFIFLFIYLKYFYKGDLNDLFKYIQYIVGLPILGFLNVFLKEIFLKNKRKVI